MFKKLVFFGFLWMNFGAHSQNIKTIQLKPLGLKSFTTIIPLGNILELSFDDLDADQKNYFYRIEQMDFNWKPSNLLSNEYIEGFSKNSFQEYENSFNTYQSYTHYKVQIPNNNTRITKSGNYLISVLDENESVLFTRRFTLYESIVNVGVSVLRSRDFKTINQQQTVQFSVNHTGIYINNPSQEINIAVLQNYNWKTAITNLKPQFYRKNRLEYKYIKKSNFWGGNEFLNFDTKSIRNSNLQVAKVVLKNRYHSYLYPQEIRAKKTYTYNPDINGQFLIRTLDGNTSDSEADYTSVHFALETEELTQKEIYVYGAFNNYVLSETNKMQYDAIAKMYTSEMLLKQGFYNYCFVTKKMNNLFDFTEISGSFYQTENEYTVLVYYTPFGENYDRVIGIGTGVFNPQQ